MQDLTKFIGKDQMPSQVQKNYDRVIQILTEGEEIEYFAINYAFFPDSIVLTNKRVIAYRVKSLGFVNEFSDFLWRDVLNCHISEDMVGVNFKVTNLNGDFFVVETLPKDLAKTIYRHAQLKEEEQREFRRQKDLEEKRAGASNVLVNGSSQSSIPNVNFAKEDFQGIILKLKELLDLGIITQEEFNAKKAEILSRI